MARVRLAVAPELWQSLGLEPGATGDAQIRREGDLFRLRLRNVLSGAGTRICLIPSAWAPPMSVSYQVGQTPTWLTVNSNRVIYGQAGQAITAEVAWTL